MTKIQRIHENEIDRPPLAGLFEEIYQRLLLSPGGENGRILVSFAISILNGGEFDLSQLDMLPNIDRQLSLRLFDYCMKEGLSEEDRSVAADALAPYMEMHSFDTRH